ncbi:C-type lectin domain family 2 member D11 [Sigmodon hispidus]
MLFFSWYSIFFIKSREVSSFLLLVIIKAGKKKEDSAINRYAACPRDWIGLGSKCFYFSEKRSNWTFSQNFCKEKGAQLAHFDSMEELNFLERYKGPSDHWIGLHRDSSELPWMWTNNTKYDNSYAFRLLFLLMCCDIVCCDECELCL